MTEKKRTRVVGFNHVALEVGDIDEALAFYGEFLEFELRSKSENMAFIDLGDQFLALSKGRRQAPDDDRHFGLVVEDKAAVARRLEEMGVEIISDRFLDFLDPWGNRMEIVGYDNPGAQLDTLLKELLDREPQLVSIMHSPVSVVPRALECVRRYWSGPIGVYPEVGSFDVVKRCRTVRTSPSEFADAARQWIDLGAVLIGGCCGATPSHVAALTDETLRQANI